jgi:hypothetical protein
MIRIALPITIGALFVAAIWAISVSAHAASVTGF